MFRSVTSFSDFSITQPCVRLFPSPNLTRPSRDLPPQPFLGFPFLCSSLSLFSVAPSLSFCLPRGQAASPQPSLSSSPTRTERSSARLSSGLAMYQTACRHVGERQRQLVVSLSHPSFLPPPSDLFYQVSLSMRRGGGTFCPGMSSRSPLSCSCPSSSSCLHLDTSGSVLLSTS